MTRQRCPSCGADVDPDDDWTPTGTGAVDDEGRCADCGSDPEYWRRQQPRLIRERGAGSGGRR